jgi:prepilin-type N-terminal cleavage/methylation domain-containing protein
MKYMKKGFTLIEILIVVAIIAILASVVLVGLAPAQQSGRDARRLSDLREAQNALELYYNAKGVYPNASTWANMSSIVVAANIGITQPLPNDPTNNATYYYAYGASASGDSYVIGATLENKTNAAFNGYNAPANIPSGFPLTCNAVGVYCLSL